MKSPLIQVFTGTIFLAAVLLLTCSTEETGKSKTSASAKLPLVPVVKDTTNQLLFSWFEDGKAKTATKTSDVPESARQEVRVQDLSTPPENRDPSIIFLVNLQEPDKDGSYPVKQMKRSEYEIKRHGKPSMAKRTMKSNAEIVMYSTPYCPVCKTARKWLLGQKLAYREIDISKDPKAAEELAAKGIAQGVSTAGVPIFEINGKLLPGFEADAIRRMLNSSNSDSRTSPPAVRPSPSTPPSGTIQI